MSLNIKNEETCRLAGELARLTGATMTGAITVALRDRLERGEAPAQCGCTRPGDSRHRTTLRQADGIRTFGHRPRRPAV